MIDYEFSPDFQWYVIVTRSNYEYKAKNDIIDTAQTYDFLDNINEIFIPIKRFTIEYVNSQKKIKHRIISKKILSLYVFINAIMTKEMLWRIKNLPSVAAVLSTGETLSIVENKEIENYKTLCIVNDNIYKGCKIVSKNDPYKNDVALLKNNDKNYMINNKVTLSYKDNIIQKIYTDEKFIKSHFINKNSLSSILADERINFNSIDIASLKKLLNKYSLMKNFINLNSDSIDDINPYDLDKLKNLVMKYQFKKKRKKNAKYR